MIPSAICAAHAFHASARNTHILPASCDLRLFLDAAAREWSRATAPHGTGGAKLTACCRPGTACGNPWRRKDCEDEMMLTCKKVTKLVASGAPDGATMATPSAAGYGFDRTIMDERLLGQHDVRRMACKKACRTPHHDQKLQTGDNSERLQCRLSMSRMWYTDAPHGMALYHVRPTESALHWRTDSPGHRPRCVPCVLAAHRVATVVAVGSQRVPRAAPIDEPTERIESTD